MDLTDLQLGLFAEHSRALVAVPRVGVHGQVVPPELWVAANRDVTLLAAVQVVDVDDVVADGRRGAELAAAVRTKVGLLLFQTGLKNR